MEMASHEIVRVIPVRQRFVATSLPVDVPLGVSGAAVRRRAGRRVCRPHVDGTLVHVPVVGVVEIPVMQIVEVPAVTDGRMTAAGAVNVVVVRVSGVGHDCFPFGDDASAGSSWEWSSAALMSSRT
jgi:hypothetical protein